jgi:hypothetical protein
MFKKVLRKYDLSPSPSPKKISRSNISQEPARAVNTATNTKIASAYTILIQA